jgi:hypothetical protein
MKGTTQQIHNIYTTLISMEYYFHEDRQHHVENINHYCFIKPSKKQYIPNYVSKTFFMYIISWNSLENNAYVEAFL